MIMFIIMNYNEILSIRAQPWRIHLLSFMELMLEIERMSETILEPLQIKK